MTPEEPQQPTPTRVSIIARVVSAFSYALPALGAAVSAMLLLGVLRAMRNAEGAGIGAVAAGISEANLAILITLYLAIFVGAAGVVIGLVRLFTTTTTASPSALYYLIAGILGLVPMFALWYAQSLLLNAIFPQSTGAGVSEVAGQITLFSIVAIVLGGLSILIVLASSFLPLPAILRAKRKWAPLIALLVMESAIIAMTVVYHLRTAWLYSSFRDY
ncbi:MAG TPA: hypothetical protein VFX97_01055 [Pyrinomonadaceae bacterium]|nr:hypothetical protein [Pyrinomonadaceae bacterium]